VISGIIRLLERQKRDLARRPLIALLRYCVGHALGPLYGLPLDPDLMMEATEIASRGIRELADLGAFTYFGIHDGIELGNAPVKLFVFDDGEPPYGKVDVEVEPLVAWIFSGGAAARGWRSPGALTLGDLVR
jgi:hypothetical protein